MSGTAAPRAASGCGDVLERSLVLWDGECGFCARCVHWCLRQPRGALLDYRPWQEVPSPPMSPALARACPRSVHVLCRDGRVLRGGRAVLFIFGELGWSRSARWLAMPPAIWLIELGYRVVAANRRLFGRLFFRAP